MLNLRKILFNHSMVTGLLLGLAACSAVQPKPIPITVAKPSPADLFTQASAPSNAAPSLTVLPMPTGVPVGAPAPTSTTSAMPAGLLAVTAGATSPVPPALNLTNPRTITLAKGFSNPDDILLAPDGSLLVSDIGDGTVKQASPDGSVKVLVSGLSVPEGIVILPDGSLVIAEQGKNRLLRFDPAAQTLTKFLNLKNETGQDGVDGITLDAREKGSESLIIPDSPNGILWRSSLDGKTLTKIASGFARPTGAWVEPDGSILVTDENGGALKRVHPDGLIDNLAELPIPDDVIEDAAGNIFIATLGDNAIHVIPADSQGERILVSGLAGPQGLAFDSAGNLVVTESGRNRLVKILIHTEYAVYTNPPAPLPFGKGGTRKGWFVTRK